jgi:hypothetical protein
MSPSVGQQPLTDRCESGGAMRRHLGWLG